MVDYGKSFKRPLSDLKKILILTLISLVPILSLVYTGYSLEVAKTAMRKKFVLPKLEGIGDMFINGLKLVVINLIYALGFIAVAIVLMLLGVLLYVLGVNYVILIVAGVVLLVPGLVILWLYLFAVMMRYAETKKFSSAFEFKYLLKKAFKTKFVVTIVVSTLVIVLVSVITNMVGDAFMKPVTNILVLLPIALAYFAISVFLGIIMKIFMYTAVGQAYAEK